MSEDRLLAKSKPNEDEDWSDSHLLQGHLSDVYQAAQCVLEATCRDQLEALGLSPEQWEERFSRIVELAAATHDLGKGNDHFQEMLHKSGSGFRQGLRHEWVSMLMLETDPIREWIRPALGNSELDWNILLWAIAGHHPAYNRPSPPRLMVEGAGCSITMLLGHSDFCACLDWLSKTFDLGTPPELEDAPLNLTDPGNVFARIFEWYRKTNRLWSTTSPEEKRLVAGAKNCLVAADIAGSALPLTPKERSKGWAWIREALDRTPSADQLRSIVDKRRDGQALFPFQEAVGNSTAPVTFVRAGCGSGKTLAAYHWAASQHPSRRLYFCYPTTGTATEGFRDYLVEPESEVAPDLFHGRASVDRDILIAAGDLEPKEIGSSAESSDTFFRIDSLRAWSTPIVSCTVDTVLGIVQNNRRGLYSWPALAGAAFVFDEIHAYDDCLFGALLRFLQNLRGVPVLLMTASLPKARKNSLVQCLKRRNTELLEIAGPKEREEIPRYVRQGVIDSRDPLDEITSEIESGGKVLWICNTVSRVIEAAQCSGHLNPIVYHSRFKYEDRVERHKEVIDAFRTDGPALAICSQVAEMSLDLSASLLVTDLCPVPALIQRLGRLNRQGNPTAPRPFVVTEALREDGSPAFLPYTPEELLASKRWLEELGEGPLSQEKLATTWETLDDSRRPSFVASAWFDGGPSTQVLELREPSPGVSVLLSSDLEKVKEEPHKLQRFVLPMPPPPKNLNWQRGTFRSVPVAEASCIEYSPKQGARRWQSQEDSPSR